MRTLKKIKIPEINDDLAYLCGVLAGDGYIGIRESKYEHVVNCGGNPKDEIEFYDNVIAPLFFKLFGLEVKSQFLSGTYGVRIYSKALVLFLLNEVGIIKSPKDNLLIPSVFKENNKLLLSYIKGVSDTDFGVCLKKGKYPVVAGSSKCRAFMEEIADTLEKEGFKINRYLDYKVKDPRLAKGYNIINRIEIHGHAQFQKWIDTIGTNQPKNLKKIEIWKAMRGS
jgi:hypothetical protein